VLQAAMHRASLVLHATLALIIALEGALNLIHGLSAQGDSQMIAFGSAEAFGALLFIWPRAMRVGACVLVCTFLIAAIVHVLRGEFPSEHLVYAVAVLFVATHASQSLPSPRQTPA
jgi:hypothetical protein